jgi:hypothetical protein
MSTVGGDPRLEVILGHALAGLDRQSKRIDDLRGRAAAVLSAASISAAFLASTALDNHAKFRTETWVGTVAFVAVVLITAVLIAPARRWVFVLDPRWMLSEYVDADDSRDIDYMRRDVAEWADKYYRGNAKKLGWRTWALAGACALVAVEVVAFVLDIRGRR